MTPRQRQCLEAIRDLTVDGVSPTFEAIRERMGLASKSGVHRYVTSLRERGVLTQTPHRRQALSIRNEHAEAIPFDAMAAAVADLVAKNGGRVYPSQVKAAMILAYSAVPQ